MMFWDLRYSAAGTAILECLSVVDDDEFGCSDGKVLDVSDAGFAVDATEYL